MSLNLVTLLRTSARRFPHRTALVHGTDRIDYAALDARSQRIAGALRALGVRRGDHVALMLPNVPEFTACYFGCHYLGAVVVPLNVLLVAEEITYHLEDSDAVALIAWHAFGDAVRPACSQVEGCRHLVLAGLTDTGTPTTANTTNDAADDCTIALDVIAAAAEPVLEMPDTSADDTAVILYTSGTTGKPKGAELTHVQPADQLRPYVVPKLICPSTRTTRWRSATACRCSTRFGQTCHPERPASRSVAASPC